ncbi:hypothetical protein AVEN_157785-1 [Araneus ventricosus]|uniref:Uncharacterized protein n=1 Tax=Araneus ventricosus TaxID=182803 RepID=A0A4Y2LQ92_ARAVE|nr:hypothetical protein AVEN_157785-1 [Araneus ventricosus]
MGLVSSVPKKMDWNTGECPALSVTPIPYCVYSFPRLQNTAKVWIAEFCGFRIRERASFPSRKFASVAFPFMVRQCKWSVSRLAENPDFRAHRSNSHRLSALTTGFGVERLNLFGEERSLNVPTLTSRSGLP